MISFLFRSVAGFSIEVTFSRRRKTFEKQCSRSVSTEDTTPTRRRFSTTMKRKHQTTMEPCFLLLFFFALMRLGFCLFDFFVAHCRSQSLRVRFRIYIQFWTDYDIVRVHSISNRTRITTVYTSHGVIFSIQNFCLKLFCLHIINLCCN